MKYLVIETYTDSSYNEYHHTFIVDDRKTAVKLANTLLDAFVKTEIADGWEEDDFEKNGNFCTGNSRSISNEKHCTLVEIREAVFVNDFALVERNDEYGKYYDVDVINKEE